MKLSYIESMNITNMINLLHATELKDRCDIWNEYGSNIDGQDMLSTILRYICTESIYGEELTNTFHLVCWLASRNGINLQFMFDNRQLKCDEQVLLPSSLYKIFENGVEFDYNELYIISILKSDGTIKSIIDSIIQLHGNTDDIVIRNKQLELWRNELGDDETAKELKKHIMRMLSFSL